MNPLFFLSYARDDDVDGQRPIRAFYDDLVLEVAHRRGIERTGLGFIDMDMRASERWKPQVSEALCRSQLLLCLISPNFLRSSYCGREWTLFEQRMEKAKRNNRILPVVWLPTPGGVLPAFAAEIQFGFDADSHSLDRQEALARYRSRGLRDLAYRKDDVRVRGMYQTVIEEIAQRIIEISDDLLEPLATRDLPAIDRILPRFPATARAPEVAFPDPVPSRKAKASSRERELIEATEPAWDSDDLGSQTAAGTRDAPEAWSAIASITGLSKRRVEHALRDADGRTRVWKVFEDHWPDADPDVSWDIDALGPQTAASVRDDTSAIAKLAEHTGIHERWVKRRLNAADGRTRVRTVFANEWSQHPDGEGSGASADETSAEALGMLTAAAAKADQDQIDAIGRLIEMSPRWVRRLLNATSGRTLVRNVFASYWPDEPNDPAEMTSADVGAQRAAWIREDDEIVATIAKLIEMDERWVRRHLNAADGRTYVRNVFNDRWPTSNAGNTEWDLEDLGTHTAATARDDDDIVDAIAAVVQLDRARVQRRLANAHGRTHVRKVFARYWPEADGEDDDDGARTEELGAYSAAAARDDEGTIEAIAELLGLSPRRVQRELTNADGRSRVRTVFATRWP